MSVENTINELLSQANKIKSLNEEALNLTEADLELLTQDEIASLVENIDQLDEVSKTTLTSYLDKAATSKAKMGEKSHRFFKQAEKAMNLGDRAKALKYYEKDSKLAEKEASRKQGMDRANKRLTKESLDEMSQDELSELVENFDQLDEVSRATLAQYIGSFDDMNDIDNAAEETRKAKGKISDKDANGNTNGAIVSDETKDRVISKIASFAKGEQTLTAESLDEMDQDEFDLFVESAELLDELSKKTLGSYIKKANEYTRGVATNAMHLKNVARDHRKNDNHKLADTYDDYSMDATKKEVKRSKDLNKAVNRLTKEDIDLGALFEGHELTEDFKSKATTIFETAVATRVASELAIREDDLVESVSDEMDELTEGLVYKIDGFLSYMAEQWMQKNELALDRGIKAELFESFVSGMKTLFEEHYINVPEDEFDALDEMHQQTEALEAALNESTQHNIELSNTLKEISKQMQIEEATEGLSELQAEKFTQLAENIVFENEESFGEKLDVIRENYFSTVEKQVANKQVFMSDAPVESLTEEVNVNVNKDVARYASFIK